MRPFLAALLLTGCLGGRPHGSGDESNCEALYADASDALGCPWPAARTTDDLCGDACERSGEAWCGEDAHTVGCPPECESLLESSCDWRDQ